MTDEEATKVVKIMLTADSWCSNCQGDLLAQFKRAFPEHATLADDLLRRVDAICGAHNDATDKWVAAGYKGERPPDVWEIHVY